MQTPKTFKKTLLIIQGSYFLITAIWPLIDIQSFMAVTGPKTDIWLVKTVAVLLIPIAASLILSAFLATAFWQPILIGLSSAVGLAIIDFYYSGNNTISKIYMWDGILEIIFAICWIFILRNKRSGDNFPAI